MKFVVLAVEFFHQLQFDKFIKCAYIYVDHRNRRRTGIGYQKNQQCSPYTRLQLEQCTPTLSSKITQLAIGKTVKNRI